MSLRIGILLSGKGRGSNMRTIVQACREGRIDGEVALVVSTSRETPAIQAAQELGVPTQVIPADEYENHEALDEALIHAFEAAQVRLICLAGYMRLLGPTFLRRFPVMNTHPALLPAFGGKGFFGRRVHEAVLDSGVRFSGPTIHFTDEEYDHGPIVLQAVVPVLDDDTVETLSARVLKEEHRLYPEAIQLFAQGRLRVEGRRVRILPSAACN